MENEDKITFSLDDDEIVEEEVIDRDEEYDDDSGDEEEEYYDDEDYGDEEEYDDEDYDDGYNDDYYDDRLNKVLDEIADLKRNMANPPSTFVQPQQSIMPPPQYVYQPSAPPAGSEVVMYNEISRLRDELAKNQSSLEMQKELQRIKDDMARDQKFAESQYNAEIKRLQDKIEELLKNACGPQGDLSEPTHVEGEKVSALDFDKLLSINEAVLRSMHDSDARLHGDISQLRKRVDELPSAEEFARVAESVKTAASSSSGLDAETLNKLKADVQSILTALGDKHVASASVHNNVTIVGSGDTNDIAASELLRQLYEIKNMLGAASSDAIARTRVLLDLVNEFKKVDFDVRSQTVSFKDKLGSVYAYAQKLADCGDQDVVDLVNATNMLLARLAATPITRSIFADAASFCSEKGIGNVTPAMRDSAEHYFNICDKLGGASISDLTVYLPDLLAEKNKLENNAHEAENGALLTKITDELTAEVHNESAIREKACELAALAIGDVVEFPQVAAPKAYSANSSGEDAGIFAKLAELKTAIEEGIAATKTAIDESGAATKSAIEENVAAAKTAIDESGAATKSAIDAAMSNVHTDSVASDRAVDDSMRDDAIDAMLDAIEDLKATVTANSHVENTDNTDAASALEQLRSDYIDISQKLVEISEKIAEPAVASFEQPAPIMTDDEKAAAIEDLQYIRNKLDEQGAFISQLDELRADILGISGSIDFSEQFAQQLTDITGQFDKLYEDLSNVFIESEANIINHIVDNTAVTDAIAAAKSEILVETQAIKDAVAVSPLTDSIEQLKADTQEIKDSVLLVNDAVVNSPIADAVEQLRADLSAFADLTAANVDASTADRQKLVDDVAYLREQYEAVLAERENTREIVNSVVNREDDDKLTAYLDELTARIGALSSVPDDVAVTRDTAASVAENVATVIDMVGALNFADDFQSVKDNVNAVLEAVAPINDNVGAVLEAVAPINENVSAVLDTVSPLADDVLATRDAANAALDALTPISEQLNSLLDRLDAADAALNEEENLGGDGNVVFDDGMEQIRDDLNTILDTLPLMPQSDDLIAARDNTYSILDTLANMPSGDDVSAVRDNVAAVLDAVNALTESLNAQSDMSGIADEISAIRTDTSALSSAIPEGFADEWSAVRDGQAKLDDGLEDIKFIRQKLEETNANEEVGDSLANILQDIGLVLDKLEVFERTAITNKQEIVDTVSGIREEVHINELNDRVSATGIDDQTRDMLVTEISEIRERLASIEETAQANTDASNVTLESINNQLADLQTSLAQNGTAVGGADINSAVLDEIEQIKEMLQFPGSFDTVVEDIADIKARLESGVSVAGDGMSSDGMQAIIDELSQIKEKIDSDSEYDTVAEILSLRDDVKAARIVDQDEISGELESIKNELASIASGNILDEVRALRSDIASISAGGGDSVATPSADELNLVLNEIVSLRDEVFSFRDEVLSANAQPIDRTDEQPNEGGVSDDSVNLILDELTALRADQGTITDNIDELKDIISRRTSLASDADSDSDAINAASNELNVVLDEIINLKNDIAGIDERIPTERIDALGDQVGELRTMLEDLSASIGNTEAHTDETNTSDDVAATLAELNQKITDIAGVVDMLDSNGASKVDTDDILDKLEELTDAVNTIGVNSPDAVTTDESGEPVISLALSDRFDALHAEMDEIKAAVSELAPHDVSDEISELRAEVEALRAENEQLRNDNNANVASELAELRDAIRDMMLSAPPATDASGDTSYAALIDEIRSLKDEVAAVRSAPQPATFDEDTLQAIRDSLAFRSDTAMPLGDELREIRDEIAQLRSLTTVAAESGGAAEVAAIRADIAELRHALGSNDGMYGLAEDVTNIRDDVRTLKDEPDLGVMNEILALREEFQNLREEIEDVKRIAGETDRKSDEAILSEVQSLRDQLFAISMANVNDARSGETNYESYNNLILDELASLREQIETAGSSEELRAVSDEIAQIRAALDEHDDAVGELAARVAKLANDATNTRILDELDSLRTELANQRDADLTTLNFMSEMAHLLERQNSYIAQNTGTKITDEIESLKAELASTDAVAEEVAKLRAVMTQSGKASDNAAILDALSDLREELGKEEKPSRENELILEEIARLRDEITALADRGGSSDISVADDELSESLSDLKNQLNEIAGIVDPDSKPAPAQKRKTPQKRKPAAKKSSGSGSKTGKKSSGTKKTTKSKSAPVASTATADENPADAIGDETLSAIIDEQAAQLGGTDSNSLNPNVPNTQEVADQIDKLAQKVANKLVIDQLVEQLGTDGVTDEQVEEVLNDLPAELTTIALDEQSNQVRRLANQLVIKKLRDRLNGNNSGDND